LFLILFEGVIVRNDLRVRGLLDREESLNKTYSTIPASASIHSVWGTNQQQKMTDIESSTGTKQQQQQPGTSSSSAVQKIPGQAQTRQSSFMTSSSIAAPPSGAITSSGNNTTAAPSLGSTGGYGSVENTRYHNEIFYKIYYMNKIY
jgi:hypothetical protein